MKGLRLIMLLLLMDLGVSAQTLKAALAEKDTALALKLIQNGANPNAVDANGASLLMGACHFPDMPAARFLLAHGATVNEPRSPKGRTPLMVACAYWCGLDMVKLLIKHGADVNIKAQDGATALMLAAMNEKQDVVEYLLAKGADAKAKDAAGKTALDYAKAGKVEDYMVQSVKDTRFNKEAVVGRLEEVGR